MNAILHNPYHYTGAVLARAGAAGATLLWSLIVLGNEGALVVTSYGALLASIAHENTYGWSFGALSVALLYRLVRHVLPRWYIDSIGYLVLFAAWGFVDSILWWTQRPIQPTATSTVTLTTALALYAAVALPRVRHAPRDQ